jgi:hypothetical protein
MIGKYGAASISSRSDSKSLAAGRSHSRMAASMLECKTGFAQLLAQRRLCRHIESAR